MFNMSKKIVFYLVSVILFFFIFLLFLHPIAGDGDFFHVLNTGKYVIEHKSIPYIDEYTFTANGNPWVANAWGTGVIYYILYSLNINSISIFTSFIAVVTCFLIYLWLRTYNINRWISLLVILFSASIISIRISTRPEVFTYLFLTSIFLIDHYSKKKLLVLVFLPLLFFIWSVLYIGSVFIGLSLLFILLVKAFIKKQFHIDKEFVFYSIGILLSFGMTMFNGNGVNGLVYITKIPIIAKTSGEWLGIFQLLQEVQGSSMLLLQYRVLLYLFYLVVFLLLIICTFFINRIVIKKNIFACLLSIAVLLPFFSIRNIPIAVIFSLPFFALMLQGFIQKQKIITLVCFVPCIFISVGLSLWINPIGIGKDEQQFSSEVILFLKENNIKGNIFADQSFSPYLTFNLFPDVLIYADTRDDLFLGTNILSTYNNILYFGKELTPILDQYDINAVIGKPNMGYPINSLLYSPDWKLVFVNDNYYIFLKETNEYEQIPDYENIDLESMTGAKKGNEKEAVEEYNKLLQLYPNSFNIRIGAAHTAYTLKDSVSAVNLIKDLQTPGGVFDPLYKIKKERVLALSYLMMNQCDNAKKSLDTIQRSVSRKFIFRPSITLTSNIDEFYMFYYLVCPKDVIQAKSYLKRIIDSPSSSQESKERAISIYDHYTKND